MRESSQKIAWGRLMELDNASIIERIVQQRPQVSVPLDLNLVRGCLGWFSVGAWNFIHHSLGFFQTAAFLEDVGIDVVLEKVHLEIFREQSHSFNMLIHSKLSGVGISPAALGLGYPMVFKSDQVHPSVSKMCCLSVVFGEARLVSKANKAKHAIKNLL